jgi:hypothetical protein
VYPEQPRKTRSTCLCLELSETERAVLPRAIFRLQTGYGEDIRLHDMVDMTDAKLKLWRCLPTVKRCLPANRRLRNWNLVNEVKYYQLIQDIMWSGGRLTGSIRWWSARDIPRPRMADYLWLYEPPDDLFAAPVIQFLRNGKLNRMYCATRYNI